MVLWWRWNCMTSSQIGHFQSEGKFPLFFQWFCSHHKICIDSGFQSESKNQCFFNDFMFSRGVQRREMCIRLMKYWHFCCFKGAKMDPPKNLKRGPISGGPILAPSKSGPDQESFYQENLYQETKEEEGVVQESIDDASDIESANDLLPFFAWIAAVISHFDVTLVDVPCSAAARAQHIEFSLWRLTSRQKHSLDDFWSSLRRLLAITSTILPFKSSKRFKTAETMRG